MTDPRLGLPSASSSERYYHCAGSFLASRGMPETTNEDAEAGTRIHEALADWFRGDIKKRDALGESDRDTFDKCLQLHGRLIADLGPSETHKEALIEKRLWLRQDKNGFPLSEKIGSGQCDLVVMRDNLWLVIDWKTGRQQTTPAEANHQLRSLVGILRQTLGNDRNDIYAAIISPWNSPQTTVVKYDYQESLRALQVTQALFRSALAGGPRTPGDHCKWCPALGTCAEAQQHALVPINEVAEDDRAIVVQFQQMAPERLATFLNHAPFAEDVIAAAKAEAKRRLELDPDSIPGYTLKPGAIKETISDIQQVFARFVKGAETDADRERAHRLFMQAVRCNKGDLKDALKAVTGSKGEQLERELDELLAGCTEKAQNKASLEKVKP